MADGPAGEYSVAEYLARWQEVKATSRELEGPSLADRLALCEAAEPGTVEALLDGLGPEGCLRLAYSWEFWGRPKQQAPIQLTRAGRVWRILMYVAGRGHGKTRPASEWIVERLERGAKIILLVGPSEGDTRQFMIGGLKRRVNGGNGSGLLDSLPPWIRFHFREDDGIIEFPDFGAEARIHSAEVPEYRGPEPDTVWGDELLKWRYPKRLLDNIRLACRAVGKVTPQILLTTSPKKLKFLRDLVMEDDVVTIYGRTEENRGYVDEHWYQSEAKRLKGTAQGAEELEGELGVDDGGAMFPLGVIDAHRVEECPSLDRCVVAVDPAASKHRKSDETGIVGVGRAGDPVGGHGYVLGDKTGKYTPEEWGDAAFDLLEAIGAGAFVVERNNIGDTAASTLRAAGYRRTTNWERARKGLPPIAGGDTDGWKPVERKETRGLRAGVDLVKPDGRRIQIVDVLAMHDKAARASPVSTLYETGRMHHVGRLEKLETEVSEWDPSTTVSPNRLDALVHAAVFLFAMDQPAPRRDAADGVRGAGAVAAALRPEAEQREASLAPPRPTARSLAGAFPRGGWGSGL